MPVQIAIRFLLGEIPVWMIIEIDSNFSMIIWMIIEIYSNFSKIIFFKSETGAREQKRK